MDNKKIKRYEKPINILLDILIFLFGIILLISIYNGIQVKILKNDYSSFFGYSIFEVQTGSMADAINAGDWIITKSTQKPKLNDVITFKQNDAYITHRVIEVYKGTYVTQGDANNTKDEPINQNQIVGKVVKILPHFGILRKTLFNPMVLIALIVTLYVLSYVIKKNKDDKDEVKTMQKKENKILEKIIAKIKQMINDKKQSKKEKIKENIPKKEQTKHEEPINSTLVTNYEDPTNIEEIKKEQIIEQVSEEDLDKTICFRVIPVDKAELDETFLEIAQNQLKDSLNNKEIVKEKFEKEEEEIDDDSLIKSNLEMLQNKKGKKCKNIIDKIMFIKNEEINEIIDVLNDNKKLKVNETTIKEKFLMDYIDAKYYNYCGDINIEYNSRNMVKRISEEMQSIKHKIINQYQGNDNKYSEKTEKYAGIFTLLIHLEQADEVILDLQPKKELYKEKIVKYIDDELEEITINKMINKIIKIQKIYNGMIEYSLKKLETNVFKLNYSSLTNLKKTYGLSLEHNIAFSKVYSDYIVDKTYSEGIIAEDKIEVTATLLLQQLVKDMIATDFNKKYILYIPSTLYEKENKFNKLFKMLDDEYAKNNVIFLIKYKDLIENKKEIRILKKTGYKFALAFDETIGIKEKDYGIVNINEYIFINKKMKDKIEILSSMPSEIIEKIVYEDIGAKVGDFGGE